jgi:undecaprenyl-diphosphatase
MDALVRLDAGLFRLLAPDGRHPVLDLFFPLITQLKVFAVPLALAWIALFWRGDRRTRVLLLALLLAVGLSDLVSSHGIKPLVARERPCHVVSPVRLFFSCKGSYSMPSSHAANLAAAAVVLGAAYRRWIPAFALAALLVGYSRVYIGLHYPGDVLVGYAVGAAVGFGVLRFACRWTRAPGLSDQR